MRLSKGLYHLVEEERREIERLLAIELANDPSVAFAYLYGSFVEPRPFRDIDVGVHLQTGNVNGATAAVLELAQRLSKQAKIPVDVRVLNGAPVSFLYHVLQGKPLACRDETLLVDIMERTASQYLDLAPLVRRGAQEAFAA
jgi:predicted nucleotidyltransferase